MTETNHQASSHSDAAADDVRFIGDYEVLGLLGSGGMGEVYLVQHPRLPRRDAMKLLDAKVCRDPEFRTRFNREADLLAQLHHPNIITIHDRGEFEGRLWLAMEYTDGFDVARLLRSHGALEAAPALQVIAGAGAALDYAYRRHRISHRDVKPANILVEFEADGRVGAVKLADFGIAKTLGEATAVTSTGITIGTVGYMSPEACEGRTLDNRADLYSLACTAFELLTGTPPYTAESVPALLMAHVAQPVPSISRRNPRLPGQLDIVFARAMAKWAGDRYQTCGEFVAAIRTALEAAPISAVRPRSYTTVQAETQLAHAHPGGMATGLPTEAARLTSGRRPMAGRRRTVPLAVGSLAIVGVVIVAAVLLTRGSSAESTQAVRSACDTFIASGADADTGVNKYVAETGGTQASTRYVLTDAADTVSGSIVGAMSADLRDTFTSYSDAAVSLAAVSREDEAFNLRLRALDTAYEKGLRQCAGYTPVDAASNTHVTRSACAEFFITSDQAVDRVNAYVTAFNNGGDVDSAETSAVGALTESADAVSGMVDNAMPHDLYSALSSYSDSARTVAEAISSRAQIAVYNARKDQLNDASDKAKAQCRSY